MSIQRNLQLSRYVFSRLIKCLGQNIQNKVDCKRPSYIKQMNRVDHKMFVLKYALKLTLNYIKQA